MRITQKNVAEALGVHHTTVSLALRNHPSIPAATRERVKAKAKELGYSPDPILDALNVYRLQQRRRSFQGVIGWIDCWTTLSPGMFEGGPLTPYFAGAQARCAELGFKLTSFALGRSSPSSTRLSAILRERGIKGVIIPPMPGGRARLNLRWEEIAAVTVTRALLKPTLHSFSPDHYTNTRIALRELRHLGRKRPGLILLVHEHQRTDNLRLAAFLNAQHGMHADQIVPALVLERLEKSSVLAWIEQHRPDSVLMDDGDTLRRWLADSALPPERRPLVVALGARAETGAPKVMDDVATITRLAVDFLVGMIQRGETGLPEVAATIEAAGHWVGPDAEPRARAAST